MSLPSNVPVRPAPGRVSAATYRRRRAQAAAVIMLAGIIAIPTATGLVSFSTAAPGVSPAAGSAPEKVPMAGGGTGGSRGITEGDGISEAEEAGADEPAIDAENLLEAPQRTSISMLNLTTGELYGTGNQSEPRGALSIVKLFIADYVVRNGTGDASERDMAETMIRFSDDALAGYFDEMYPMAIDEIAADYGLTHTDRGEFWGLSETSAADVVKFLVTLRRVHPDSPIPDWMNSASPIAADGTAQDWGTARLPGVTGSKWGWADDIESGSGSVSIGDTFIIASFTEGSPEANTEDVLAAVPLGAL